MIAQNKYDTFMGTSLMVQRLKECLTMQGCRFDPWSENKEATCQGATQPQSHNF